MLGDEARPDDQQPGSDQVRRHVAPAEPRNQKVTFRAEVVDEPLALSCHAHLGLLCTRLVVCHHQLHMLTKLFAGDWPLDIR